MGKKQPKDCFWHLKSTKKNLDVDITGVVAALSLEVFKARLDEALSTLVWWKMSLLMAGGLELDDL